MAERRASVVGLNEIMTAYDGMSGGVPYYSVWHAGTKNKFFQWNQDDPDEGRNFLYNNLSLIDGQGDTAMYFLVIHPEEERIYTNKSPQICSMPIRVAEHSSYQKPTEPLNGNVSAPANRSFMEEKLYAAIESLKDIPVKVNEHITAFEIRIKALEEREVEPAEKEPSIMGQLGAVLNNPQLAPVIGQLLSGVMARFMPVTPPMRSTALAGVAQNSDASSNDQDDLINNALDRLEKHCDLAKCLPKLADLADNDPAMFKMLLSQLK